MPSQTQEKKQALTEKQSQELAETDVAVSESAKASRNKLSETDELLDEIDGVLETNAEEFVKAYVQQGGE